MPKPPFLGALLATGFDAARLCLQRSVAGSCPKVSRGSALALQIASGWQSHSVDSLLSFFLKKECFLWGIQPSGALTHCQKMKFWSPKTSLKCLVLFSDPTALRNLGIDVKPQ